MQCGSDDTVPGSACQLRLPQGSTPEGRDESYHIQTLLTVKMLAGNIINLLTTTFQISVLCMPQKNQQQINLNIKPLQKD